MSQATGATAAGENEDSSSAEAAPPGISRGWKIALSAIGLLLLGLAGLWIIGGMTYRYQTAVTIEAPPEVVFRHLVDGERMVEWMGGVTEVRQLTNDGHRVGARAVAIVEQDGQEFQLPSEVLESRDSEFLRVQITTDMFTLQNAYRLQERAGGTDLSLNILAHYQGFARFFGPFAGGAIRQQIEQDFQRLKTLIESPAEVPEPE